jgi:hypothetical protein
VATLPPPARSVAIVQRTDRARSTSVSVTCSDHGFDSHRRLLGRGSAVKRELQSRPCSERSDALVDSCPNSTRGDVRLEPRQRRRLVPQLSPRRYDHHPLKPSTRIDHGDSPSRHGVCARLAYLIQALPFLHRDTLGLA